MEKVEYCSLEKFVRICHSYETDSYEGCTLSKGVMPAGWESPLLRMKDCVILLCTSGGITVQLNGERLDIPAGALLVCPPNSAIRIGCLRECRFICLIPTIAYLGKHYHYWKRILPLLVEIRGKNVLPLPEDDLTKLERMAGCVKECIAHTHPTPGTSWANETLLSSIRMLLCAIFDKIRTVADNSYNLDEKTLRNRSDDYFVRFMDLLCIYYKQERRVEFYASRLCVTPKYLSAAVKKASGKTPCEWIDNAVMEDILHLLRNSQNSIKEIACSLNFDNISFFGKYVKRHTGVSPTRYRAGLVPVREAVAP